MFNLKKVAGVYVIGILLGLLVGAIFYFVQPVQYKAQALIRIGQISQNESRNVYFIEPIMTVVERIKLPAFIQAVAERAKRNEILRLLNAEEGSGMTVKQMKAGDALLVTVVAGTPDLARISAASVVDELVEKHAQIADFYRSDIRAELSKLDRELGALSRRIEKLLGSQAAGSPKQAGEREMAIGFNLMTIQRDLEYKLNRSSSLRESISNANVRPTMLLEPIGLSERRIFLTLWRPCLLGGLLGFVLSVVWIRLKK